MANIANEVTELCDSILIFETYISKKKDQLFLFPQVNDLLIWNHLIGGKKQQAQKQDILEYLTKNNVQIASSTLDLLVFQYSTNKLQTLTKDQLAFIFLDYSKTGIYQIMQVRKQKFSYANNFTPHFKITDLLIHILVKTLEFLEFKQKMKQNIYAKRNQANFQIEKCDPNHFLVFINRHQPSWLINQCRTVLNHILKLRKKTTKQFFYFFVPYSCQSRQLNPNEKILSQHQDIQKKITYKSIIDHRKLSHYGNKQTKLKKTLYLK